MESLELKNLVKDLFKQINYHDFYYNYADDSRAYNRGEREERDIVSLIKKILQLAKQTGQPSTFEDSLLRNCLKLKKDAKLQETIKAFFRMAKK